MTNARVEIAGAVRRVAVSVAIGQSAAPESSSDITIVAFPELCRLVVRRVLRAVRVGASTPGVTRGRDTVVLLGRTWDNVQSDFAVWRLIVAEAS